MRPTDEEGFATARRHRLWQTLMIVALNEVLKTEPPKSRKHGKWDKFERHFNFRGVRIAAYASDADFDEINVKVMLNPTKMGLQCGHAAFLSNRSLHKTGVAYASGWMERNRGRWLQLSDFPQFYAAKLAADILSDWDDVRPEGYEPSGRFIM